MELKPKYDEKTLAEYFWLQYLNQYLYEHQSITEDERNRIANKISMRLK